MARLEESQVGQFAEEEEKCSSNATIIPKVAEQPSELVLRNGENVKFQTLVFLSDTPSKKSLCFICFVLHEFMRE